MSIIHPSVGSIPQVFVAVRLRRSPSTCSPYVRNPSKVTSGPNLNDGLARNAVCTLSSHTASFLTGFFRGDRIVCAIRYDIHVHICDSGLGGTLVSRCQLCPELYKYIHVHQSGMFSKWTALVMAGVTCVYYCLCSLPFLFHLDIAVLFSACHSSFFPLINLMSASQPHSTSTLTNA